jgi:hypothetical protein
MMNFFRHLPQSFSLKLFIHATNFSPAVGGDLAERP